MQVVTWRETINQNLGSLKIFSLLATEIIRTSILEEIWGTNNSDLLLIEFILTWSIIGFWTYFKGNIFKPLVKWSLFFVWYSEKFSSFCMIWFRVWLLRGQSLGRKNRKSSARILKAILFQCNPALYKCF